MLNIPDIKNRRELFIDNFLIAETHGASLKYHTPERREIVMQTDDPEFSRAGFDNLFYDNGRIRLYYRGVIPGKKTKQPEKKEETNIPVVQGREHTAFTTTHYAESADGIHFEFPDLGIVEWRGSRKNNVILTGHDAQNFCVFRDDNPSTPSEKRYKAVGGDIEPPTIAGPKHGLTPYSSPDGIHWKKEPGYLAVPGMFDSLNVPFWDSVHQCYRLFSRFTVFRYATPEDQWPNYCRRDIQSCKSPDFIHWTKPELHSYTPGNYEEQYYTNATQPCPGAEHIFLSFPMRFVEERVKVAESPYRGLSDTIFMASRDGNNWQRSPEAYFRPDTDPRNWVSRANIMASGIIPSSETEWSLYIRERYFSPANCLRRLAVRPWGFASLHTDADGGEVITKPFCFSPGRLRLNYSTSAAGSVLVELIPENETPIQGFSKDCMDPLFGNELDKEITWGQNSDLSALAGQPVRLRFHLKDADIFSFRIS